MRLETTIMIFRDEKTPRNKFNTNTISFWPNSSLEKLAPYTKVMGLSWVQRIIKGKEQIVRTDRWVIKTQAWCKLDCNRWQACKNPKMKKNVNWWRTRQLRWLISRWQPLKRSKARDRAKWVQIKEENLLTRFSMKLLRLKDKFRNTSSLKANNSKFKDYLQDSGVESIEDSKMCKSFRINLLKIPFSKQDWNKTNKNDSNKRRKKNMLRCSTSKWRLKSKEKTQIYTTKETYTRRTNLSSSNNHSNLSFNNSSNFSSFSNSNLHNINLSSSSSILRKTHTKSRSRLITKMIITKPSHKHKDLTLRLSNYAVRMNTGWICKGKYKWKKK